MQTPPTWRAPVVPLRAELGLGLGHRDEHQADTSQQKEKQREEREEQAEEEEQEEQVDEGAHVLTAHGTRTRGRTSLRAADPGVIFSFACSKDASALFPALPLSFPSLSPHVPPHLRLHARRPAVECERGPLLAATTTQTAMASTSRATQTAPRTPVEMRRPVLMAGILPPLPFAGVADEEKDGEGVERNGMEMADTSASLEAKADDGASSDGSGDDTELLGVVKITSADPRAAARVAASLKQHDYDRFTRLAKRSGMPRRQRGDAGHGGGSVVGERVYSREPRLPAQLLREAEPEVGVSVSPRREGAGESSAVPRSSTPATQRLRRGARRSGGCSTRNNWLQGHWQRRQQQRQEPEQQQGPEQGAARDAVNLVVVVARFGGADAKGTGAAGEQHAGHIAPPTPRLGRHSHATTAPRTSTSSRATSGTRRPSMEVPKFTPFGKRAMPPRRGAHAGLLEPVGQGTAADA
ncbi:hypothetical protein DFH09DRAFT_1101566 [Mycena vulgaris]|nr:hypothetical protein DFH09DRAFT_1101566 [Mycena vulgaris]